MTDRRKDCEDKVLHRGLLWTCGRPANHRGEHECVGQVRGDDVTWVMRWTEPADTAR
jgi:hypothetical protein